MADRISSAVITRLPRYYRYLGELLEEGVDRISSKDLSVRMKVTASQIRQDLNNFFLSSTESESPPLNTPLRQLRSAFSIEGKRRSAS